MLINMRNGLMAGKRLPYDAEVEYLESTGTQKILAVKSPVTLGDSYDFETKVSCFNPATSPYSGFGTTGGSTTQAFLAFNQSSGAYLGFAKTPTNDVGKNLVADPTQTHIYRAQLSSGTVRYFADGELKHTVSNGTGFTIPYFGLFQMRVFESDRWHGSVMKGQIYYCKLTNGGESVFNFIPVRFTNELGQSEGAMYDRANPTVGMDPDGSARTDGLYRNRGTGAFLYGNDI